MQKDYAGLSSAVAADKLLQFGPNIIVGAKQTPAIVFFLRQFKNSMVIILMGASIFAFFAGEEIDAAIILGIVFLNAFIGFIQEFKAEKAIEALQKMLSPKARVIRDNQEQLIDAKMLVPDDIVLLNEGDKVSADCKLIESNEIKADEAILTGESVPVSKNTEKESTLFMGTQITHGTGRAIVLHTGMQTEFGKIATLTTNTKKDESPLQKEIAHIGGFVGKLTIGISLSLFLIGFYIQGRSFIDTLLFAVSVAVAAVPEGLPTIITIALALGVQRLAKKNAIIKQLSSVETLGSTTIICSDKTGTLTKNEMTVQEVSIGGYQMHVSGVGYEPNGSFRVDSSNDIKAFNFTKGDIAKIAFDNPKLYKELELAMHTLLICNNAKLIQDDYQWKILGDPTEGALITLAEKVGIGAEQIKRFTKIAELPFDSERKLMSVIAKDTKDESISAYIKGAPESILDRCTHRMINGEILPLNKADKIAILEQNTQMASQALRTIGIAYKSKIAVAKNNKYESGDIEQNLIYVGVVGMIDPPRAEVKEAVKMTKKAGIRIFIITGDYGPTALAIAQELGIAKNYGTQVITGDELHAMSDGTLSELVTKSSEIIFARVNPSDKLRIVDALKNIGEVVAVTGDGVNDAPALKRADIGVAMGITGTDVSKEAANMVLTDDSFGSIVTAIIEGRTIYANMKKFIFFIFSSNIGELVAIFATIVIGLHAPLTAVMLLLVNTLTDVFPALALGIEPVEKTVLEQAPRNPKTRIMERPFVIRYVMNGIWIGLGTAGIFVWSLLDQGFSFKDSLELDSELYIKSSTMAFVVLTLFQMVQAINARSVIRSVFNMPFFQNLWLIAAILLSTVATILFVQLPIFNTYLRTSPLSLMEWLTLTLIALSILLFEEGIKYRDRRNSITI